MKEKLIKLLFVTEENYVKREPWEFAILIVVMLISGLALLFMGR